MGKPDAFDQEETAEVVWVPLEKERSCIVLTRNMTGRERDLAVLDEAIKVYRKLRAESERS